MESTFTLQCISTTSTGLQWHLFKTASSAAASGAAASGADTTISQWRHEKVSKDIWAENANGREFRLLNPPGSPRCSSEQLEIPGCCAGSKAAGFVSKRNRKCTTNEIQ